MIMSVLERFDSLYVEGNVQPAHAIYGMFVVCTWYSENAVSLTVLMYFKLYCAVFAVVMYGMDLYGQLIIVLYDVNNVH